MSGESCYLCTETNIPLWKICSCASSYICDDCLKLTEININDPDNTHENRFKCHICRQNLNFEYIPSFKYYSALFQHFFPKILLLSLDLFVIYAIVNFSKSEYPSMLFTNQAMFILNSLFHVLLVKNACLTFLENIYQVPYTDFQMQYIFNGVFTFLNFFLFGISFIDSNVQIQDLYFILVVGFLLSIGFTIISLMAIFDKMGNIQKFLKIQNQYLRISVLSAYFPNARGGENSV